MINKIGQPLDRLTKDNRKMNQVNKIANEKDITTYITKI